MAGLPRRLIKLYGVSKKAWAVFRGEKKTTARHTKSHKRSAGVKTHMAKRRSRSRAGSSSGGKLMNGLYTPTGMVQKALLGVGAAAAVDKLAPNLNIPYKHELAAYTVGGVY